jgi:hypothetical protein
MPETQVVQLGIGLPLAPVIGGQPVQFAHVPAIANPPRAQRFQSGAHIDADIRIGKRAGRVVDHHVRIGLIGPTGHARGRGRLSDGSHGHAQVRMQRPLDIDLPRTGQWIGADGHPLHFGRGILIAVIGDLGHGRFSLVRARCRRRDTVVLSSPHRRAYKTCATSSNSTGTLRGKTLTPTALRTCLPASPKISTHRSLAPLAT